MPLKSWDPADFPEEPERGLPKWEKSYVRDLMLQDLEEGVIPKTHQPHVMDTREIFLTRPEYKLYGFKNFYNHLKGLRDQLDGFDSKAAKDKEAFEIYKRNHPPSALCSRGYPHWEGSIAQQQLKVDIDNEELGKLKEKELWKDPNKPENVKPKDLWLNNFDYRRYPLDVFRNHIYQEIRTRKYLYHLEVKSEAEKSARIRKHEKFLERSKKRKQKEEQQGYINGLTKYSSLRKAFHTNDLKTELIFRGVEDNEWIQLRTFTNRKRKLKELEIDRTEDAPDWVAKAAGKAFKILSPAAFELL